MSQEIPIALVQDPHDRKKVVNRLKRAHGQLAAVIQALEADNDCKDVMQQLSAVSKAIDRAGFLLLSGTLRDCLTEQDALSSDKAKEIEKLFLSLA